MTTTAMTPEQLRAVTLLDEDEEPVASKSVIGEVNEERRRVWLSRLNQDEQEQLKPADKLVAVSCVGGRGPLEHAVRVRDGVGTPLLLECKVSYEELPPSMLVEYTFDNATWRLSFVCLDYLLSFRKSKFQDWEKRITNPTCKAELKRMLAIGVVTRVYDHYMFPSTEAEMQDYQVTDENGKTVVLPRPVAALRIWSTEKQAYEPVDATLDGAPDDTEGYWKQLIAKLKTEYPDEVEELLSAT